MILSDIFYNTKVLSGLNIAMNLATLLPDSMDSMQVAQRHTGEWRYLAKTEGEFRRVVRWRREAA
jgi:hypothetical protein